MNIRSMLAILLAVPLWLTGCETTGGGSAPSVGPDGRPEVRVGLVPQTRPPISDVPIPVGFNMVESVSRHYNVGAQRFIDHTYQGRESKFDVDRFYRERMPIKDWVPLGNQMIRGKFTQRYEKQGEVAEITIDSKNNAFGAERTNVSITIRPQQPGPAGNGTD
jgi:hypothetical protein